MWQSSSGINMSISSVTSEALQLKLRQLLPSQQGFGTDLSASDTIIPVIDLTAAAEGSDVGVNLQTAFAFGSQTAFSVDATPVTLANTPGFWRIAATFSLRGAAATNEDGKIELTDGVTSKTLYRWQQLTGGSTDLFQTGQVDFTVFLDTGESVVATGDNFFNWTGSYRQIADKNGTLVQPSGFNPQ
jgi:hypothetical protein